jgi:aspartate kinase
MQLASGEKLTAHLLHAYLKQSGIYSALVDTIDADFPLRLNLGRKSTAATIDMEGSREAARNLKSKYNVIIVPGYVGRNPDGLVRTLGRGGSDTAAFAYAYAFGANQVWIVAEDALTTAPLESARVVEEINLNEAWDAGFFGARLKTHKSIEPLEMFLDEHPNSHVYITGKEMGPRKTRINPQAKEQTVRFIASGIIRRYGISGDWRGFLNQLYSNSAVDWFLLGGMVGELGIGVSERGWELADAMIRQSEERGYIKITHHDNVAYIGVVGSGMSDKKGIANRAYRSLRGVNILRAHDPNVREPSSTSIGIMVDPRYERQAVESLHREFFR